MHSLQFCNVFLILLRLKAEGTTFQTFQKWMALTLALSPPFQCVAWSAVSTYGSKRGLVNSQLAHNLESRTQFKYWNGAYAIHNTKQ